MKQHITKEQWDEVHSGKHYQKFRNAINITEVRMDIPFYEYITIGQMIEFLGDDWHEMEFLNKPLCDIANEELCNALWMAVKHKLKQ